MAERATWREHPFHASCVENDMVAKVLGWASDLHHDPELSFWRELLAKAGVSPSAASWSGVEVKFFAYPRHFGGDKRGGEIGDVVLLGPRLLVVIEAKRPYQGKRDPRIEKKRSAAVELADENGWVTPIFIVVGTEEADYDGFDLVTWQEVSATLQDHLGNPNRISEFIDSQVALLGRGRRPTGPTQSRDHRRNWMNIEGFENATLFVFTNWDRFDPTWVREVDSVATCIQRGVGPACTCKRFAGSWSFLKGGKTIGKLAPECPEAPRLMVGFSVAAQTPRRFAQQLGRPASYYLGPKKEPFWMVACDPTALSREICDVMVAFLRNA